MTFTKMYAGVRLQPDKQTASSVLVMVHLSDGESYELKHNRCHARARWPCHSPDGFNWSYAGSGPAELAKYILMDLFGREAVIPQRGNEPQISYQDFKAHFVASFEDTWELSEDEIRAWAATQRRFAHA